MFELLFWSILIDPQFVYPIDPLNEYLLFTWNSIVDRAKSWFCLAPLPLKRIPFLVASGQLHHISKRTGGGPAAQRRQVAEQKGSPTPDPFACSDYTYPSVAAKRCHVPLIPQILFQESRVVVLHFVNIIVEWKTSRDKIGERRRSIVTQGKQFKQLQPERTTVIFGLFCSAVVRKPCTYHSFAEGGRERERDIYTY